MIHSFKKISDICIVGMILLAYGMSCDVSASPRSEYWEQKVSLFDVIPVEPGDIVFLGNSITDGGEFSELFGDASIKNRGISADVISGVMDRLHQVVDHSPSKIFLLIGINDISHNLTVEHLAGQYEELVAEIKKRTPSTKLYIQSIMPVNNDFGRYKNLNGKESVILQLNQRIKDISSRNDAVYVDLWPALADPNTGKLRKEFTNDGLHLLGKGYAAWVKAIQHLVKE